MNKSAQELPGLEFLDDDANGPEGQHSPKHAPSKGFGNRGNLSLGKELNDSTASKKRVQISADVTITEKSPSIDTNSIQDGDIQVN